jgi:hypothetical protein
MILYNVTVILEEEVETEWLDWMRNHHIPQVMATNCFASYKIFKILESQNEGITFSVQYFANDFATYDNYRNTYAPKLQEALQQKFANKLVAFRTIMELI